MAQEKKNTRCEITCAVPWSVFCQGTHAEASVRMCRWPLVAEIARKAFAWRYKAMPALYTAFYDSHAYGCPVARPMFYTFPADTTAWDSNTQFMVGDGLLVNGTDVTVYFPQGTWYSLYDHAITDASKAPMNTTLQVRGGPCACSPPGLLQAPCAWHGLWDPQECRSVCVRGHSACCCKGRS